MKVKTYATDVVKGKKDSDPPKIRVSYEPTTHWYDSFGQGWITDQDKMVILITRCCAINHDHYDLNKEEATILRDWLTRFIDGEFTQEVTVDDD